MTLANAWGVLAMEKFSKVYEAVPVAGATRSVLGEKTETLDWNASPRGKVESFPWPGKGQDLAVTHVGSGRPWVAIQSLAAIPRKEPFSSGYKIKKTVIPVEKKNPNGWTRGDILRIRLEVEAQADQTWVVVSDPIPAGSTILGTGLARDSALLTQGEEKKRNVRAAYEERSFEAFRAYFEYVPKGGWSVEYTLRLNQSGNFQIPATRAEALYFPEMLGEVPNPKWEVAP